MFYIFQTSYLLYGYYSTENCICAYTSKFIQIPSWICSPRLMVSWLASSCTLCSHSSQSKCLIHTCSAVLERSSYEPNRGLAAASTLTDELMDHPCKTASCHGLGFPWLGLVLCWTQLLRLSHSQGLNSDIKFLTFQLSHFSLFQPELQNYINARSTWRNQAW